MPELTRLYEIKTAMEESKQAMSDALCKIADYADECEHQWDALEQMLVGTQSVLTVLEAAISAIWDNNPEMKQALKDEEEAYDYYSDLAEANSY